MTRLTPTPEPSPEELSYRWAHEDAVEMGYPSLTEALEHLSELRASRTPEPDLAKLLLGDIESGRVAMGSSCDCDFCRSALTASPAEPEEATEATHWVFHGKVAHVYTMRTACGKDYRYPVKGTDYAAHRVTCPDCRAALRSAASGGDTV